MSWSFHGAGKPVALAAKVKVDLARYTLFQPEAAIKDKAVEIIELALGAYPPDAVVRIEAAGSQQTDHARGGAINSLTLKIEPIYGFVE